MTAPLAGIRILDFSRLLPGPFATQVLADFGADIIKVEDTRTGDGFRHAEPKKNGVSVRHLALNRNKRSLAVDLKKPEGREIILKLATQADVVLEQFRPGVMARLGLGYEDLKKVNPKLVYCSLSGFGQESPFRNLAAHDPQYLALAGVLSLIGHRGGPPSLSGLQIADMIGALMTAVAILIAVRQAEKLGIGDNIDMSLFDSVVGTAVTSSAIALATGKNPERGQERHTGLYPMADVYETKDGGYVSVSAIESQFWSNLCRALGHEEWIEHHYAGPEKAEEIRNEMRRVFRMHTRDEWFERLKDKDCCLAPVLSLGEALHSEAVRARELTFTQKLPEGDIQLIATPIRMANADRPEAVPAPALGEHSSEILASAGFLPAEIEAFHKAGVVRGMDTNGQ